MLDAREKEPPREREGRRETEGETGQEKINRPANMCREKDEGRRREGGREREREDGVERTHREARSHDLMNELAWLLAPWWGTRAAFTLPRHRLSSFARRLSVPWREGRNGTERDGTGLVARAEPVNG